MAIQFRWSVAAVLLGLLAGCANNNGNGNNTTDPKWSSRPIRAPKEAPLPPPAKKETLESGLIASARTELDRALASNDPFIRAHAVEAAQNSIGAAGKTIYLNGLKDTAPQVRFASAMAVGGLQISEAKWQLEQMINDDSAHVGIGVRFALHRLGNSAYTKELEVTARDSQWQIRATTALALGLLGEPTAVRVLKPMLRDLEAPVRLQAAEALWRLGNEEGLKALVGSLASNYADDQMVALLALAGPKDRRVLGHVRGLLTADYDFWNKHEGGSAEVELVAARAVGMLGSDEGYLVAVEGTKRKDPRQRSLAALALGAIGRSDAQGYLGELLKDGQSADVRLSAAQGLLQLRGSGATARGE